MLAGAGWAVAATQPQPQGPRLHAGGPGPSVSRRITRSLSCFSPQPSTLEKERRQATLVVPAAKYQASGPMTPLHWFPNLVGPWSYPSRAQGQSPIPLRGDSAGSPNKSILGRSSGDSNVPMRLRATALGATPPRPTPRKQASDLGPKWSVCQQLFP